MREPNGASGYSVDVWDEVARRVGVGTELVWVHGIDTLLGTVSGGQADVAIGPISMTPEREGHVDLTHPVSEGGLGILVSTIGAGPVEAFLDAVIRPGWLVLGLFLTVLVVVVGLGMWLPRRGREGWPDDVRQGLHESAWRSARIFLSGAFGEHEPRTARGRLGAMTWIVAGIILTSLFTAAVTSNATVARLQGSISGPDDLAGKRIVTVGDSTSADWLESRGLPFHAVTAIADAYPLLEEGHADAIVFDQLILRYHATSAGAGRLAVVGPTFERDPYGFAVAQGSPLREAIESAILSMIQDGTLDAIHTIWFGSVS
jgi:ABC-type amino acid transport substrate-binding protein